MRIYSADSTNDTPVSSIYLYGQVSGEVALSPEALYWSVPSGTNVTGERPESLVLRRVTIRSASGQVLTLKNPKSTIKGLTVELVPKETGQVYELVARLGETPASSLAGCGSVWLRRRGHSTNRAVEGLRPSVDKFARPLIADDPR